MTTVTRPALLSAMAYMLNAAGITVAELAKHMGQRLNAKPAGPAVHVVAKKAAIRVLNGNETRLIEAAGAPEGLAVTDVMQLLDLRDAQASRYCTNLTKAGHLVGVKKPGVRAMRFFASADHARAWSEVPVAHAEKPARVELSEAERKAIKISAAKRAAAHKAAPPLGARTKRKPPTPTAKQNVTFFPPQMEASRPPPQGQPVVTEATRRTIDEIKRPNSRIEAAPALPADPRWPSFAATPPGVNPETGGAWV